MLRVSTTTIESFRLYMTGDWMPEEELVATIRGEFRPNRAVLLGQAFDSVINEPERFAVSGGYRHGEFFFSADMMVGPLALFDRRGLFQVKHTKDYAEAQVVAVADQLLGATLIENKTTCSTFDADKYERSCQWRFMADIFEPKQITYNVFCLSDDDAGLIDLRSIETINFYPYAELHRDCCDLLSEFLDYVKVKGLTDILAERYRKAAA